jgi:tRNA (guanine-N7-)-methyltransferase
VEFPLQYSEEPLTQIFPPVEIADVGCGFGGLLFALSLAFPHTRSLGFEIRDKVTNYVAKKIFAMREEHPGQVRDRQYMNIAVIRTNSMKLLPNYIPRGQLMKLFFCFPDPNFKKSKFKRRIVK